MFLALREMKHAKFRYVLIGFIMVLIAWLVFFVSGLAQGLSSDNASSIEQMKANYFVLQKDTDNKLTRSILEDDVYQDVKQLVQEQEAAPLGVQMTTVIKGNEKMDVTFFAIDPKSFLMPAVKEGSALNATTANEVIADRSLQEEGMQLGDLIQDEMTGKEFTIVGFTENQSFSHTPVIFMNFAGWSSMQQVKFNSSDKESFNGIALNTTKDTADSLGKQLTNVDVITQKEALQGIPGFTEEQGSLLMMIVFLFIIAAFVLAVFFYVMTIQKINQFGVLKAIGAKQIYLAKNMISQVIILAVSSLLVSIGLTYVMANLLPSSMPFEFNTSLIIGCSALFLTVSLAGSLISLYKVKKVDAVDAIGRAI